MRPRLNIKLLLLFLAVLIAGVALGGYYQLKQEYRWIVLNSLGQLNYLSKVEKHLANGNQQAAKDIIDGELRGQIVILSDPQALDQLNQRQRDFVESEITARKIRNNEIVNPR